MMEVILDELHEMSGRLDRRQVDAFVSNLAAALRSEPVDEEAHIIGLGAGRMGYALRSFIMRLSHMGFSASMIGDTNVPRVTKGTIILVNSSSGETPSITQYVRQACDAGGQVFSTTCRADSSIGIMSANIVTMPSIESVQLMKSPYEQFSMLFYDYLVIRLMQDLALDPDAVSFNHSILE